MCTITVRLLVKQRTAVLGNKTVREILAIIKLFSVLSNCKPMAP